MTAPDSEDDLRERYAADEPDVPRSPWDDLLADDDPLPDGLPEQRADSSHDDHLLVITKCHEDGEHPETPEAQERFCWDAEWEVLHPPACYRDSELAQDPQDQGPTERCGLDWDLNTNGGDVLDDLARTLAFQRSADLVQAGADPLDLDEVESIADVLPAGAYLIRWGYGEHHPQHSSDDYDWRSWVELVPGPVWDGDRQGWS